MAAGRSSVEDDGEDRGLGLALAAVAGGVRDRCRVVDALGLVLVGDLESMRLGVDDLESLLLLAPGLGVSCRGALDALGDCALEDCALEDCALEDRALGDGALLWLVVFWTRIALVKSVVAFVEQAVVELEVALFGP